MAGINHCACSSKLDIMNGRLFSFSYMGNTFGSNDVNLLNDPTKSVTMYLPGQTNRTRTAFPKSQGGGGGNERPTTF